MARKISLPPLLVRELPKILVPVHEKNHVTRTLPEGSMAVEEARSLDVPQDCLTQRGLPEGSSLARKISVPPLLVRELPKMVVPVHEKYPVTRTLPEGSVAVEEAISELVPHDCLTQRGLPEGSSFARKISSLPLLVKELPKMVVPVHWKVPVTRTLPEESVAVE